MQKSGISTEIYSLINDEQVKPYANLVISDCSAYDYLNNSKPNLEKLTTQYYDTFSIASRFTGYLSNITLGNFYNNFSFKACDSSAILGGLNSTARTDAKEKSDSSESSGSSSSGSSSDESSSVDGSSGESSSSEGSSENGDSGKSSSIENTENSSGSGSSGTQNNSSSEQDSKNQESQNIVTNPEDLIAGNTSIVGEQGVENIGIAVFNGDKFCGKLTATESICHLLITNNVDSCIISIDSPFEDDKKIELLLTPKNKTKVFTEINGDSVKINLDININADIITLEEGINYEKDETLDKISESANKYLKNELNKYLDKVSRKYNCDIDHFCMSALGHFATIQDWENFNWREKYKNADFDVNVNVKVVSSLLVTKT